MRKLLLFCFWFPWAAYAEEIYLFEPLINSASEYIAPPLIQTNMTATEMSELLECQAERKLSDDQIRMYFLAVQIDLNEDRVADYLVLPSIYCFPYFGAHSTEFWILLGQTNGAYKRVFEGRRDGVEILSTKHHGLRDLKLLYGNESELYRFVSSNYKKIKK